ncbi:dehydration-responsive element-binding protein 1D-like [Papaver somniferum]|uniref:dehydration-responsive element-binding protein 1D-like n=1 Tax=Papaver somniferum TaxID=3469 RepID=UPI000E6FF6A7|nr:dehydration-responsive element-binding protein 1D-like [Papaver somniferum]
MNYEYSYEYSSLSSPSSSSSGTDQRLYSDNNFGSNGKSPLSSLASESPPQLVSHKKRAGRKKFKETRHPIYRGVRERKNDKWVCEVREPGNSKSRIWLGTHSSPEMAARAYDVAALALRGKSAPLNFENSPWVLPRAKSSSIKDIQAAVAEASLAFPFSPDSGPSPMMTNRVSHFKQLSRRVENNVDEAIQENSSKFLDEEALFNMPSLIASMAEGMLLDPPKEGYYFDDLEYGVDSNLWSE